VGSRWESQPTMQQGRSWKAGAVSGGRSYFSPYHQDDFVKILEEPLAPPGEQGPQGEQCTQE
jgi:hypothetical protein